MLVSGLGERQRLADLRVRDLPRVLKVRLRRILFIQRALAALLGIIALIRNLVPGQLRKVFRRDPAKYLRHDYFDCLALIVVLDLVLVIALFGHFKRADFIFCRYFIVVMFVSGLGECQRLANLCVLDRPRVHETARVRFRVRNLQFTSCRAFRVFVARVVDHIISCDLRQVCFRDPAECLHHDHVCRLACILECSFLCFICYNCITCTFGSYSKVLGRLFSFNNCVRCTGRQA